MENANSQQNHSESPKYGESSNSRRLNSTSGCYGGHLPISNSILFHQTHGVNISITDGGRVASRTNSFYAIAFTSRSISIKERVHIRLQTVNNRWQGVLRLGVTTKDPSTMVPHELPKHTYLKNPPGYWTNEVPEYFAQKGNVISFYVHDDGNVYYLINNIPKGVFLEGVDIKRPLWGIFDLYGLCGRPFSLRLLNGNEDTDPFSVEQSSISHHSQPVSLPPDMFEHAIANLSITEPLEPISFSATMGKQVKCRNRTHITRRDDIVDSGLAFTSTALNVGETAYFYCAERKPNGNATLEDIGFGIGVTTCDPTSIPIEQLPFDATTIMDRPEHWILFRDFEAPRVFEYFALKIEKEGCLSYTTEAGKSNLFHMEISQPLYLVIDMTSNVSSLAIVGMSSELELNSSLEITEEDLSNDVSMPSEETATFQAVPPHPATGTGGISSDADAAVVAPLIVSGLLWLGSRFVSHLIDNITSSKEETIEQGNQDGSDDDAFIDANDNTEENSSSDEPITGLSTLRLELNETEIAIDEISPNELQSDRNNSPTAHAATSMDVNCSEEKMKSVPEKTDDLEQSKDSMGSEKECVICCDNLVNAVVYTCGHACLCFECGQNIKKQRIPTCPICRARWSAGCFVTEIYSKNNLLQVEKIYTLEEAKFMFRYENLLLPPIFQDYFTKLMETHAYSTRSVKNKVYFTPRFCFNITKKLLKVEGVRIWESIPLDIKTCSPGLFNRKYKEYLYKLQ